MSAARKITEARGIGFTSQRTRDRMVERLREQGIRDGRDVSEQMSKWLKAKAKSEKKAA